MRIKDMRVHVSVKIYIKYHRVRLLVNKWLI